MLNILSISAPKLAHYVNIINIQCSMADTIITSSLIIMALAIVGFMLSAIKAARHSKKHQKLSEALLYYFSIIGVVAFIVCMGAIGVIGESVDSNNNIRIEHISTNIKQIRHDKQLRSQTSNQHIKRYITNKITAKQYYNYTHRNDIHNPSILSKF